jgi:hypothetical protein
MGSGRVSCSVGSWNWRRRHRCSWQSRSQTRSRQPRSMHHDAASSGREGSPRSSLSSRPAAVWPMRSACLDPLERTLQLPNPYDGHALRAVIEVTRQLAAPEIKRACVESRPQGARTSDLRLRQKRGVFGPSSASCAAAPPSNPRSGHESRGPSRVLLPRRPARPPMLSSLPSATTSAASSHGSQIQPDGTHSFEGDLRSRLGAVGGQTCAIEFE